MPELVKQEIENFVSKLIMEGKNKIFYSKIRSYCDSNEQADRVCNKIVTQTDLEIAY
jgi:hypothetical protein